MILFYFPPGWFSSRDYPDIEVVLVNFTESVVNDEKYTVFVHSKSYPAVFFFAVFLIFNRQHIGVKKDLRRTLETDIVPAEVYFGLRWVPFKIVRHGLLPTSI